MEARYEPAERSRDKATISAMYERIDSISGTIKQEEFLCLQRVMASMDSGQTIVVEKRDSEWCVNTYLKEAILLYFKLTDSQLSAHGNNISYDKVPLKFGNWSDSDFKSRRIRFVHGSIVRYTAHICDGVVLLPCFINVGAHVGKNTMIDTWSTIGSCAYVGDNCHISGGVGIGGVLEPPQALPVIIEDNCFIGARSEIAEGVIVGSGAVISMGVKICSSTRIIDRSTGRVTYGHVPNNAVVVPGCYQSSGSISISCAVIAKYVDEQTRSKVCINDILRTVE